MKDLTIGIIGTGRIGAQVVRNLSGFGCRILAYDLRRNPAVEPQVTYVDFDTLLAQSDVITSTCLCWTPTATSSTGSPSPKCGTRGNRQLLPRRAGGYRGPD